VYSSLIAKARNIVVEFHLCTGARQLAGRVIEVDDVFVEAIVQRRDDGGFAATLAEFEAAEAGAPGWREDRVLINIADISIIA
jgi:hypothetical protein